MRFQLWRNQKCEVEIELDQPIELGRQKGDEPEPFSVVDLEDRRRCIIAHHAENTISRNQLRVTIDRSCLVVTNLNTKRGFELEEIGELAPNEAISLDVYSTFRFLDFEARILGNVSYQSLPNQTLAPGQLSGLKDQIQSLQKAQPSQITDSSMSQQKLITWLSKAMLVFQDAATNPRFLKRAAEVVRDIVELTTAAVLLKTESGWETKAISAATEDRDDWQPSRTILDLVSSEKKTFYNLCEETSAAQSLMGVQAIVASPILSGDNEVIGVVYGD